MIPEVLPSCGVKNTFDVAEQYFVVIALLIKAVPLDSVAIPVKIDNELSVE